MNKNKYIETIKNRSNGWILPAALLASCGVIAVPAIVSHGNYEDDLDQQFNKASCETFDRPSLTSKTYVVCDNGEARLISSQPTQFGATPSSVTFDFANNVQNTFLMTSKIDDYYREDFCEALEAEGKMDHPVAKLACG
ncbi:MAG: hypothetical protein CL565_06835 [Alphaproteobacteria bacterium]|nr:hypothetical protein [Alphaproteobacteria bacterium]